MGSDRAPRARKQLTTITVRNLTYDLRPESYWHLTPAQVLFCCTMPHNGQGICWSTSAIRRAEPDAAAVTFYGALGNVDKENAWERIREAIDKNLPTRQHAFFFVRR
jgi:hypothetical protein